MRLLLTIAFPFFILSCALTPTEGDDPKKTESKTTAEPVPPVGVPVEEVEDGMTFADPNTTGELLSEEDKKTVSGPVPVTVPEPAEDSAIDIKPSIPTAPPED